MNLLTLVICVRLLALEIVAHVFLRQVAYNNKKVSVEYNHLLTAGIW